METTDEYAGAAAARQAFNDAQAEADRLREEAHRAEEMAMNSRLHPETGEPEGGFFLSPGYESAQVAAAAEADISASSEEVEEVEVVDADPEE